MAIKKGIHKGLAEVGKIKTGFLGEEVTSRNNKKFRPPKKLSHFMITTTERDDSGNLIRNRELHEKIGDRPTELKIRLPFDTIDKNFFTEYQCYSGGKKLCAGDGETAQRRGKVTVETKSQYSNLNHADGEWHEVECNPEKCPIHQAGKCKVSGILSVFLPEAGNLGGVYKYRTHSWNGVSSILGALEFFAANTGGVLQGLPLKLVFLKKTTAEHGTIGYATVVLDEVEIHGLRRLAIEESQSRKALGYDMHAVEEKAERSGFFKDTDPEDIVDAEFYGEDGNDGPEPTTGPEEIKEALEDAPDEAPAEGGGNDGEQKKDLDLF